MNKHTKNTSGQPIHVVAAVIFDDQDRVLITRRPAHVHQGGLWEFPGGKVEEGETTRDALARELHEELGINVLQTRPLIRVSHSYKDKDVLLDVKHITQFKGDVYGKEGQPVLWVKTEQLSEFSFPEANIPIIRAVQLPEFYLITPDPGEDIPGFLRQLEKCLSNEIRMVQLRAKSLSGEEYVQLAHKVKALCVECGAKLILNSDPNFVSIIDADGVNLTGDRLMSLDSRPIEVGKLVSASCHTEGDILHAEKINVDFSMLSPVQATASHPDTIPLGWSKFQSLCERAPFPVYALGGVKPDDLELAIEHGAQGIAAIRALWNMDK